MVLHGFFQCFANRALTHDGSSAREELYGLRLRLIKQLHHKLHGLLHTAGDPVHEHDIDTIAIKLYDSFRSGVCAAEIAQRTMIA